MAGEHESEIQLGEPGRAQKIASYRRHRGNSYRATRAFSKLTLEEGINKGTAESFIKMKDAAETAAGIISRDIKGK